MNRIMTMKKMAMMSTDGDDRDNEAGSVEVVILVRTPAVMRMAATIRA